MIPLFDIKPKKSEIKQYLNLYKKNLLKADFIQGQQVKELEKALSDYTKIKYVQTCANGTDALVISLKSLNLKKNSYVITTPFSWISTAHAIINCKLIPLFVDVSLDDFNLDLLKIKLAYQKFSKKISCVLSVDIFGNPNKNNDIYNFCKSKHIKFVIDGAQSFGSKINNRNNFQYCDIATTSFFPTKPLGCFGDGGAIFTKNYNLYKKIRSYVFNGMAKNKSTFKIVGINSRLDTIHACILLKKLNELKIKISKLKKNYKYYKIKLSKKYKLQKINDQFSSSYALTSIVLHSDRNKIFNLLKNKKINCGIYYNKLLSEQNSVKNCSKNFESLKNAKFISKKIISIPNHISLKRKELDRIIKVLNSN